MKKELLVILFLFFLVLTSVSLFSYYPEDPSLNNQSYSSVPVQNHFGLVGAHLSGILIGLLGVSAFWIPLLLLLEGVLYFREKARDFMLMSLGGGCLLILSTGAMLSLFRHSFFIAGRDFPAGGFLGSGLAMLLVKYANSTGSVIILLFFLFLGIVLLTGGSAGTLFVCFKRLYLYLMPYILREIDKIKSLGMRCWDRIFQKNEKKLLVIDVFEPDKKPRKKLRLPLKKQKKVDFTVEPNEEKKNSLKFNEKAEEDVFFDGLADGFEGEPFVLPPATLLNDPEKKKNRINTEKLKVQADILEKKLNNFGVSGEVVEILPGPVITTFEYRPSPGIKISKIVNLTDDLALALSALSIRIIAPIPGKDVIGVEIPNEKREMVVIKEMLTSSPFIESLSKLTLGLGKDILGRPVAAQMNRMPHLLIAGATGTGKSVGLNTMIVSLLYKATPEEVKFIMVDPKRIELSVYDGIPHLISPVVTDMKKATNALMWAVREMERRYELLAENGVRNILQYNSLVEKTAAEISQTKNTEKSDALFPPEREENANINSVEENLTDGTDFTEVRVGENSDSRGNTVELEKMPYIVVIVDEFADLMMVASKDVESALIRLAQMARAAGIHLILATQRPSVDVLTGIIKANFPTRISFQVSSRTDSRTILDANGSERLLGNGDMLFLPPGTGRLQRIQCAYISEEEIARVTAFLKKQQPPDYVEDITQKLPDVADSGEKAEYDEKYDAAVAIVTQTRQASISSVQRHLRIGYNRAARIIETMEKEGLIGPQEGSRPREVLVKSYEED